jgi:hypothetical protein
VAALELIPRVLLTLFFHFPTTIDFSFDRVLIHLDSHSMVHLLLVLLLLLLEIVLMILVVILILILRGGIIEVSHLGAFYLILMISKLDVDIGVDEV